MHEKISRLAELAEGWENHENIDPIERDIALELLRGLYSELRFGKASEREIVEDVEETVHIVVPEPEPLPEPIPEPEREVIPEPAPVACAVPQPSIEDASSLTEARQSLQSDGAGSAEGGNYIEPLPKPEPAPAAEEIPSMPRRGVNPEVIRSLYGDSNPTPAPAPQTPAAEPEPMKEEEPVIKETPQAAAGATLGDIINTDRQTLGDTMQNGRKDMASQIAASEHPDLKRSIGINDRFLMIRDMFYGDAAAYEEAIEKLDTFTDLDDAIIYIHDTYNWNADSDGVKLLIDLLERKLG